MIVKKGNQELLEAIDRVLERLRNDGTIDSYIVNHTTK